MSDNAQRVAVIKELIKEAVNELAQLEGVDYKLILEAYDEDDRYIVGAEESNNWHRSWC